MDWWATAAIGAISAIGGGITAALALWQRYHSMQTAHATEMAAVEKLALENQRIAAELAVKVRKDEAELAAAHDNRIDRQRDAFIEEIKDHFRHELSAVIAKVKELEMEGEKRREEHVQCQLDNAKLKAQVETLKERVAQLEKKGAP